MAAVSVPCDRGLANRTGGWSVVTQAARYLRQKSHVQSGAELP